MNQKISVLIIEDNEDDEELILRELARGGLLVEHTRVTTSVGLHHAIDRRKWDVILCDYLLPGFRAPEALKIVKQTDAEETPFIIVSGAIDEETAIEIMQSGADDFVLKGKLSRLVPVVKRELEDSKTRAEKNRVEQENRRLRAAIGQSGETIIITDIDGNILYVNSAFEISTGYLADYAMGKNPRILKSGKQSQQFYKNLWETILAGQTWKGRLINKNKVGTLYEEAATISPVFGDDGKISNFVAIISDVTKEAMLTRAKDYFTSVTSHEMFTPLSKLLLVKNLVQEMGNGGGERLDMARTILEDAYSNFERISSATSLLSNIAFTAVSDLKPTLVRPIIAISFDTAKERIYKANRNVTIKTSIDTLTMETTIAGDQRMVSQMLQEILSNAVKYTPDNKEVAIFAREEGAWLVIEIQDQGPGIPEEQRNAVFQPFFSLENPMHHQTGEFNFKGGGIGLGLTLAKMIADFHHGFIDISSNERGARVTIRLPLSPK